MTEVSVVSTGAEPTIIRMGDNVAIVVKFRSSTAIAHVAVSPLRQTAVSDLPC